jgi:hypothetical protein
MNNDHNDTPSSKYAVNAVYTDSILDRYKHNPLIEALPPIMDEEETLDKLEYYPLFNPQLLNESPNIRMHELSILDEFFYPMGHHITLERWISQSIRSSYISKNPIRPHIPQYPSSSTSTQTPGSRPNPIGYFQQSASLTGTSGIGKSYSIAHILNLIPPVIWHSDYEDKTGPEPKRQYLGIQQLTWLKVECPFDGSTRTFCKEVLAGIDKYLGTNYLADFKLHTSIGDIITNMVGIFQTHAVGLLVIDEIQNLLNGKAAGANKLLSLLVQIVNSMEVPVLLVGTPKAIAVLSAEFRQARRSTGLVDPEWYPPEETHRDWIGFSDKLWQYNYVSKTPTNSPMPEDIRHTMFDLTQGITGLAKVLFALVQKRALDEGKIITTKLIEIECARAFVLDHKFMDALRRRDFAALRMMPDLFSESHIQELTVKAYIFNSNRSSVTIPHVKAAEETKELQANDPEIITQEAPVTKKARKAKNAPPLDDTLMSLAQSKSDKAGSVYDEFKAKGNIIRQPTE